MLKKYYKHWTLIAVLVIANVAVNYTIVNAETIFPNNTVKSAETQKIKVFLLAGQSNMDGRNIWPVLSTQQDISPHEKFFYYQGDVLRAVRSGKWKLHRTRGGGFELFNLQNDISEESNLANRYPEIVKRLESYMTDFDIEMNDSSRVRPHGTVNMFD
jgi:arylsulfatase A-like enzyme